MALLERFCEEPTTPKAECWHKLHKRCFPIPVTGCDRPGPLARLTICPCKILSDHFLSSVALLVLVGSFLDFSSLARVADRASERVLDNDFSSALVGRSIEPCWVACNVQPGRQLPAIV